MRDFDHLALGDGQGADLLGAVDAVAGEDRIETLHR